METRKHNILSRFFNTGTLDRAKLQSDVDRLTAFYYNHGYLQVHIGDPVIDRHGNSIIVTVTIDEGPVFTVGKVGLAGDLKFPKDELTSKLTLKPKKVFSGADMEHDVLTLSDFYSDRGYAFVNVDPRTRVDPVAHRVDITYAVTPGNEVLIDRIKISGNTKTSDKVIRREIRVQEQEPYSASKIQASKQRLDSLGYFQSVRVVDRAGARSPTRSISTSMSRRAIPRPSRSAAATTAPPRCSAPSCCKTPISSAAANRPRSAPRSASCSRT